VIVAMGSNADQITIGNSLGDALDKLFGQSFDDLFGPAPPSGTGSPTTTTPTPNGASADPRVQDLIRTIQDRYAQADAALKNGDLKTYIDLQDQIRTLFGQLNTLVNSK
jgi:uncharacterized membrane protein (UPF0182 family)